ncbi:MAG: mercury resistance system periplasmic binding protein MerP [Gammaproteobacteria bacterium]
MSDCKVQQGFTHTGILPFLLGTALTVCCVAITTAAEPATVSQQVVTLEVENMTCMMCPVTVRKSLTRLDGVNKAEVSYKSKTATVTYDPQKVTVAELIRTTTNAGYPSTVKE